MNVAILLLAICSGNYVTGQVLMSSSASNCIIQGDRVIENGVSRPLSSRDRSKLRQYEKDWELWGQNFQLQLQQQFAPPFPFGHFGGGSLLNTVPAPKFPCICSECAYPTAISSQGWGGGNYQQQSTNVYSRYPSMIRGTSSAVIGNGNCNNYCTGEYCERICRFGDGQGSSYVSSLRHSSTGSGLSSSSSNIQTVYSSNQQKHGSHESESFADTSGKHSEEKDNASDEK